jgi:hypothetical protein
VRIILVKEGNNSDAVLDDQVSPGGLVGALVNLKDRDALEEMREQRERFCKNPQKIDGSEFTDDDITEIEADC